MAKVESARQAVEIAREFLNASGMTFHLITKAMSQKDTWVIEAITFMGKFMLKIDKSSGEVIEYTQISA